MNVKMFLPSPKFIVGVVIVLVMVTAAIRLGSDNAYVQKARGWIGLYPGF